MGVFDAEERAVAIAKQFFSDDLAAVAASKKGNAPATVTIYPGLSAEEFGAESDPGELPGLGIYTPSAQSSAVVVGKRDWNVTVVFDFFAIGKEPRDLSALVKWAANAILRTVDRMVQQGSVLGTTAVAEAGAQPFGVTIEIEGSSRVKGGADFYQDRVRVTVPVVERDEIT